MAPRAVATGWRPASPVRSRRTSARPTRHNGDVSAIRRDRYAAVVTELGVGGREQSQVNSAVRSYAFTALRGARGPEHDGGSAHGGWLEPVFEEALAHQIDTLFAGDFALLLGRRTYEISAPFWPCMHDDDPSSTLYPQLLQRDRLVLMIAPITLGGGKRLTAHQGVQ